MYFYFWSWILEQLNISLLQIRSVAQSCPTLCDPMNHSMPGLPVHHQLPEFTQTHVHQVSDAIQPSHPLSPTFLLPSAFPSIRVFSNETALHIRWSKYWSFSINPSSEYSGLISFRIDWEDIVVHKLCPYVYKTTTTNADKATRAERWSRIDYILQLRHLQWQLSPTHIRERFTCYFCSAKKILTGLLC